MEYQSKPGIELKPLSFLIGQWQSEGEISADYTTPAIKIKGTDSYEWVLEGSFILHRADVMMGDKKTEVIELIGTYDSIDNAYLMRSFDNQGDSAIMQGTITADGILEITGDGMRSELSVSDDGRQMTAHWQRSEEGTWIPWMNMNFTK